MLVISNDPLAPRQRLVDPSSPPAPGDAYLADAGGLVVARGQIVPAGRGWLDVDGIEAVEPFYLEDGRSTVLAYSPGGSTRQVAERPDQRAFRERLMHTWGGRCAVTGCDVRELLDAAHLRSWRLDDEGVLLRTDLHRMLDRGLAEIRDGRFHLRKPVPGYECVDGAKLRRPRKPQPRRNP